MINLLTIPNPPAKNEPGTHALVIGLSVYPYLPGGSEYDKGEGAGYDFGMQQLSSPALSAYYVACWLRQAAKRLSVPLASCRLVIAPSPEELARIHSLDGSIRIDPDDGRFANVCDALYAWRKDANSHPDNVTWFYFSGHGVQFRNPFLLTTGYNHINRAPFHEAIDFGEILDGMVVGPSLSDLARRQFFAIDSCRTQDPRVKDISNPLPSSVWSTILESDISSDRKCAVVLATRTGMPAYGQHVRPTPFARALVRALKNHAADAVVAADGTRQWVVESRNLLDVLDRLVPAYSSTFVGQEQEVEPGPKSDNVLLVRLDRPPIYKTSIRLNPTEAHPPSSLKLIGKSTGGTRVVTDLQHPYTVRLVADNYRAELKFAAGRPFGDVQDETREFVRLPRVPWEIRCPPRA